MKRNMLSSESDLIQKLQADKDGTERKRIMDLLQRWKTEFSNSQIEEKVLMEDVLNLAIKMVQEVSSSMETLKKASSQK